MFHRFAGPLATAARGDEGAAAREGCEGGCCGGAAQGSASATHPYMNTGHIWGYAERVATRAGARISQGLRHDRLQLFKLGGFRRTRTAGCPR